jgi:endonuclease/exonuclease/phosphatase family metal-dependent hydrolase
MVFKFTKALIFFFFFLGISHAQVKIASYNLLNYPGSDTTIRNPYFRTVVSSINPDVLVVQEMTSQAGVNGFLNGVMNYYGNYYGAGVFIDGPDTDCEIFFRTSLFIFLSNTPIPTKLRNIYEFKIVHIPTHDTLRIYSVHLKASTGYESDRAAEVDSLRKVTNALPPNSYFIVCGDFNIYTANESAYQKLLQVTAGNDGNFNDPINMPGAWQDNPAYAAYHTQSTRIRSFGGGATGGLDDRFDLMLYSNGIKNPGLITYINNSVTQYGNDGNHLNDSINQPPNTAVSQTIANALHNASDHLPVYESFTFSSPSVNLALTALLSGNFNGTTMVPKNVLVELHNSTTPYALIDSQTVQLNSSGAGNPVFTKAANGTSYYIVIKSNNGLETWSATPQTFSGSSLNYNFTSAVTQAYGSNLILVGTKWCIISGDVNQDGSVDALDRSVCWNDRNLSGVFTTDLNGDGVVDALDRSIAWNNRNLSVQKPALAANPGIKKQDKSRDSKGTYDLKLDGSKSKRVTKLIINEQK